MGDEQFYKAIEDAAKEAEKVAERKKLEQMRQMQEYYRMTQMQQQQYDFPKYYYPGKELESVTERELKEIKQLLKEILYVLTEAR